MFHTMWLSLCWTGTVVLTICGVFLAAILTLLEQVLALPAALVFLVGFAVMNRTC